MKLNRLEAFPDLLVCRVNRSEIREIETGLVSDCEERERECV